MIFKIIGGKAVRYDSAGGITKIDDISVDFSQAESRENIAPTDTMKTILGKIMKWFSDLSAGAASSLLGQNLTEGKVLVSDDGGKVAASVVDASKVGFLSGVTGDVQEQINSLNSAMPSVIKYLGVLTLETGIDNADTGYYRLSKYPIDGIDTWGTLLCINSSVLDAQQLILGNYGRAGIMYRWKNNGSWVGWKTMQII